jgi:hypothetical protein
MELKIIKNNLLIEYVEHKQMNREVAEQLVNKYKDCNILEYKFQFIPNIKLIQTADLADLEHNQIQSLTITLQ